MGGMDSLTGLTSIGTDLSAKSIPTILEWHYFGTGWTPDARK